MRVRSLLRPVGGQVHTPHDPLYHLVSSQDAAIQEDEAVANLVVKHAAARRLLVLAVVGSPILRERRLMIYLLDSSNGLFLFDYNAR